MYLSINNVTKIFPARGGAGEVKALDDVSLEIEKGELVTMLGPSGCGKTTTLRMVAGFEFPTNGNIYLDGVRINTIPTHKRDMSMVFQSYAIFPHLNVYENIAYGLKVKKVSPEDQKRRIAEVLDMVHLEGYEQRAPNQLSGGQQQRVALARALVMQPKVLLMDEPLSNLDTKLREEMRFEIHSLQKQLGFTCLYVTHDQTEAMVLSDKIVVMNIGKIEQVGPPQTIYRYPATRFVSDFIGRANFLEGIVIENTGAEVIVKAEEAILKVSDPHYSRFKAGETVDVIVRPEMVNVSTTEGMIDGTVLQAAYLGDSIDYVLSAFGKTITARETDPAKMKVIPEGSAAKISFAEDCIHLLPR
jgi:iron(III) transport system ATP-binding protein